MRDFLVGLAQVLVSVLLLPLAWVYVKVRRIPRLVDPATPFGTTGDVPVPVPQPLRSLCVGTVYLHASETFARASFPPWGDPRRHAQARAALTVAWAVHRNAWDAWRRRRVPRETPPAGAGPVGVDR